jgi:hypothetical protein
MSLVEVRTAGYQSVPCSLQLDRKRNLLCETRVERILDFSPGSRQKFLLIQFKLCIQLMKRLRQVASAKCVKVLLD